MDASGAVVGWRRCGLCWLGLAGVVALAHFGALDDGLFFDDYWHRVTLRAAGWNPHDLTESATFDLPGPLAKLWWLERPLQWRYARTLAMATMKLEYTLARGDIAGVHAFGLLWHWLASVCVFHIALWALRRPGWALLAGFLFALHPQSVFCVSWTAARNALVSGLLIAAATWAYLPPSDDRTKRAGTARLTLAIVLWIAALFSRETAIVFPALAAMIDLGSGGWRSVRRRGLAYVLFAIIGVAYLYWRLFIFPMRGAPSIYFTTPHGPEYLAWAGSKLLHMVFALIWHTPMLLGLATFRGLSPGVAGLHTFMALAVALVAAVYIATTGGVRTRWVWLAWVVIGFLPVIPVFLMPHFAYMPAIGFAIAAAALVMGLPKRWRVVGVVMVVAYTIWSFGIYRFVWRGVVRSEQVIYADIAGQDDSPPAGTHLFLINLPPAGIYSAVALREIWNQPDLSAHVLTFAPHPLEMTAASTVTQLSDHELLVRCDAPGYFSGLSGAMLREGMRPGSPLTTGMTIHGEEFDAEVVQGDETRVTQLRFAFHRPLNWPRYRFYVCTPGRPAQRLDFSVHEAPVSPQDAALFDAARRGAPDERKMALRELVRIGRPLAQQLADPIAAELSTVMDDPALERTAEWWRRRDIAALREETAASRNRLSGMLKEREYYFTVVRIASKVFRSDLLLTGQTPADAPGTGE